jgi:hypothetical protein
MGLLDIDKPHDFSRFGRPGASLWQFCGTLVQG